MGRNASQLASQSGFAVANLPDRVRRPAVRARARSRAGGSQASTRPRAVTIVADLEGRVCFVNSEGRTVLGAAMTEALLSGRSLCEAFSDDGRSLLTGEAIPTAIKSGIWHGEASLLGQQRA